jgi:glycine cleavage system H protein
MTEFLEFTLEKFTFKVAADRTYSKEGVWAKQDGDQVILGMSDYLQQRSGDIAFADIVEAGTALVMGEPFADIETIKADLELAGPVSGTVQAVNEKLDFEPEIINQDPYEQGWMAVVLATNWNSERTNLLSPEAYLEQIKIDARHEIEER